MPPFIVRCHSLDPDDRIPLCQEGDTSPALGKERRSRPEPSLAEGKSPHEGQPSEEAAPATTLWRRAVGKDSTSSIQTAKLLREFYFLSEVKKQP